MHSSKNNSAFAYRQKYSTKLKSASTMFDMIVCNTLHILDSIIVLTYAEIRY